MKLHEIKQLMVAKFFTKTVGVPLLEATTPMLQLGEMVSLDMPAALTTLSTENSTQDETEALSIFTKLSNQGVLQIVEDDQLLFAAVRKGTKYAVMELTISPVPRAAKLHEVKDALLQAKDLNDDVVFYATS